jgi:hypothetical protein
MTDKTNGTNARKFSPLWVVIILVLLAVISYLSGLFKGTPPSGHQQIPSGDKLPEGAQACEQQSFSSLGFKFNCPLELSSYNIQLNNVPDEVTPYLLPASPEDENQWASIPKDRFDCPIDFAGNLMFADGDGNLITIFKSPVELQFTDAQAGTQAPSECQPGNDHQTVRIPVYLYTFGDFQVWKPFQNYTSDSGTVTIEFKVWGDTPIGVSLLSAPIGWGPP